MIKRIGLIFAIFMSIGCSTSNSALEKELRAENQRAVDRIQELESKVSKERALRAIDEIGFRGRVSGEAERILDMLLSSSKLNDQAQGVGILLVAVEKDPSYRAVALRKIRQLKKISDNHDLWSDAEKILNQPG